METRRRKDASFWQAINRVLAVLIVIGLGAIVVFWFYPEVNRRSEMLSNLERKRAELSQLELKKKQNEREVYLLQNDPSYIETIARDKLDLMKDGETIFRLDAPRPAVSPQAR